MRPLLALILATLASIAHASETEPVLDAAAIVQPSLLSGPGYTVAPQARVHGFMARFDMTTPFGPLDATSVEMLAVRAAELPAIEALERAAKSEAFTHALAERAKKTGNAVWQVVSNPVDTLVGLPEGVARYFVKKIERWGDRAQTASDRAARTFGADGDPFKQPQAPLGAAREPVPGEPVPPKEGKAWYERVGKEVGREVRRQLDYNKMRREMARHLGIDPYTSNPYVNARLDALAWAAVWGNLTAGTALDAIGGTAEIVIDTTGQLNAMVWQLDPENLREKNHARLANWCSDEFALRQFLRRGGFNDSLRTSLADEVEALKPKAGCNDLIEIGAGTRTELEARFLVNALRLIRRHGGGPGGKLFVVGAAIAWRAPDGKLFLPLPVDWLSWTEAIDAFFALPQWREENKTVLVGGDASLTALRELTARGWTTDVRAPYDGAPAYAEDISQGLRREVEEPAQQLCVGDVAETSGCL